MSAWPRISFSSRRPSTHTLTALPGPREGRVFKTRSICTAFENAAEAAGLDADTIACPPGEPKEDAMLDRIQVDPRICEGRPTIRGLRITVEFVLKLLGDGYTAADIVREYPELELEDVYQAAKYGAWLATERTSPIG